jgi:glycosyltransferase involved in cell wall biosynthesis
MKEPLISVNMITYNHAPYIAQAIEGVLQQKTNFPFELVIGEDCSTDGTREIVFDYQKKHLDIIRVIISEQNVGATRNLYRTEKACRGKYVAYCEGDDYWHRPDKLQKQVDYLENHPECGLVCSDYDRFIVKTGKRTRSVNRKNKRNPSSNSDFCRMIAGNTGIQTCTVMVRRDIIFRVIDSDPFLYRESRFPAGDLPRWAEISRLARIGYIDESLATYNVLPESATRSRDANKILRVRLLMKEQMLYFVDKYNLPERDRIKHEEDWCKRALKLAFYEKNRQLADEAKKRKNRISSVEWLLFWGSRNTVLNYTLRPVLYISTVVSSFTVSVLNHTLRPVLCILSREIIP